MGDRDRPALRLHFEVQYVGRLIKQAKRRVMWKFAFLGDDDEHSIVLLHTVNSGKRTIFVDGNEVFSEERVRIRLNLRGDLQNIRFAVRKPFANERPQPTRPPKKVSAHVPPAATGMKGCLLALGTREPAFSQAHGHKSLPSIATNAGHVERAVRTRACPVQARPAF